MLNFQIQTGLIWIQIVAGRNWDKRYINKYDQGSQVALKRTNFRKHLDRKKHISRILSGYPPWCRCLATSCNNLMLRADVTCYGGGGKWEGTITFGCHLSAASYEPTATCADVAFQRYCIWQFFDTASCAKISAASQPRIFSTGSLLKQKRCNCVRLLQRNYFV